MNHDITDLLTSLQAEHDRAAARADELRRQIDHLTTALGEAEARLSELVAASEVFAELEPDSTASQPVELSAAYQAIVNAFNQHPNQDFRVRDLYDLLAMPTDDPALNVTRSRLGRLTHQGFLTQPGRGLCRKGT